jgi:hypothetical protein
MFIQSGLLFCKKGKSLRAPNKHRQTSTRSLVYLCMITHVRFYSWHIYNSRFQASCDKFSKFIAGSFWRREVLDSSSIPNSFIGNARNICHSDSDAI